VRDRLSISTHVRSYALLPKSWWVVIDDVILESSLGWLHIAVQLSWSYFKLTQRLEISEIKPPFWCSSTF
jgi:hypothetical protein